ncbi:MAG: ribonuclease III domain-containing protein [Methanoregula sp.]|jgi:ribonuclease-3
MTQIKIDTIKMEPSIRRLREDISRVNTSALKLTHKQKFDIWVRNLDSILDQIKKINEFVLPQMEKDLGFPFSNRNLIVIAFVQPSLKNIIKEIKVHLTNEPSFKIWEEKLTKLGATPDTAKSIAWVGDTAIKYALLTEIWRPGITPKELHNKRQALEKNENLSKLCDDWDLFDNRIHFDPNVPKDKTKQKIEGTLTEAMFGVIFIERGIAGVQKALHLIDTSRTTNNPESVID